MFAASALTMSILMFAVALALGFAQQRLVERLRANTGKVKVWGGRILLAVGVWLIVLALWADWFARFLG